MTVLGISIGTKSTGICVLKDDELIDVNVHHYAAQWSDLKLRIIVNQYRHYIRRYGVTAIVVKISPPKTHTPSVRLILKRIEGLAKQYYCEFDLISRKEIKSTMSIRTDEIVECAKGLYPELHSMYDKRMPGNRAYYKKLYEAVLAAYIFQERQRARLL